MPNWKKLIVSGSDASLNSLNVTSALTASGFNYPTVDGSDREVLVTDGAGNLTFERPNTYANVKNKSGVTLLKGTPVHASSSVGNLAEVIAASASVASTMPATFVLNQDLANDAEGLAVVTGFINGVDTSAFSEGDVVYVGANGGYTNVKPTGSSNLIQNLGIVINIDASNGSGFIYGSGRSNDIPNLPVGKVWVGSDEYSVTSSVVHLDETNGRLGIGTTSPGEKLNISGSVRVDDGELYVTRDGSSRKSVRLHQTTDKGAITLQRDGVDNVNISSDQTTQGHTYFNGSGVNVGIAITTPSYPLHVNGSIGAEGDIEIINNNPALHLKDENSDTNKAVLENINGNTRLDYYGGNVSFLDEGSTETLTIVDSTGNVGIGNTAAPEKLTVAGNISGSGNLIIEGDITGSSEMLLTGQRIYLNGGGALIRDVGGYLGFFASGGSAKNIKANSLALSNDFSDAAPTYGLYVKGDISGSGNVTITRSDSTDTVFTLNSSKSFGRPFTITNNGLEPTINAQDVLRIQSDGGDAEIRLDTSGLDFISFKTNSGIEAARIDHNGRLGIGTTSPQEKLHVTGNISGSDTYIDDWGSVSASLASINASSTTPVGTVSSSAQIDHDQTTNFSADEHFTQANITTVGTISTGVWQGTAIDQTYLAGQSGTNTGDEPDASTTVKGIVELATTAETTTGTDTTRAVTPDGLKDGYQGSTNVTTLGTISTGTWQGSAISTTYLQNTSGTNTGDEPDASTTVKGIVELATTAEVTTGTDTTRAVTPDALNDGYQGTANIDTLGTITSGDVSGILPSGTVSSSAQLTDTFVDLTSVQTISGTKTFTDIVVDGTGSFAYIQSTTGSAKIIGDAFIVLNNDTPTERYAGIKVYDSGSAGVTGSLEFDGQTNDWFYEYSDDGGATAEHGVVLFGPGYNTKGSHTYNANNTILKGTGDHHIVDSNITDDGSTITLGSNTTVSGVLSATTFNGMISSSAQVDHDQTTNFNSNEHFTQANITTVGTVTSGDVSAILPSGVISGSDQVNADTVTNFDTNVKAKMNSDAVVSGSATNVRSFLNVEDGADFTDFTNVQAAGAVMDSEVTDLDGIKSLTVPNSTTISTFGASLVDDADAATARTTLGVDAAGTDNSTDVTLVTTSHDYLSLSGQAITLGQIDISDDTNLAASTGITLTDDTLTTNDSEIVHDNLSGFVANEHIDHSGVSITAGNGLSGGGSITTTRTLSLNTGSTHFTTGVSASAAAAGFGGGGSAVQVSVGQYTSTDTTTDVNTASYVIIPFNSTDGVTDTSNYSISSGRVTVSEAGTYWVYGHISYDDNGQTTPARANVALEIFKNGTSLGYRGAMGYLRNSTGHDEASNMVAAYVSVSANDIIDIRGIGITTALNACNLVSGESVFALNKVGGAVAASNTFADAVSDTGTALDLQYSGGSFYSMGSASSTTAYTTGSTRVGGWAKVFVNASSKPTVGGSTEMDSANSGFTTSTDCYLVVTYDGSNARHFFTTI